MFCLLCHFTSLGQLPDTISSKINSLNTEKEKISYLLEVSSNTFRSNPDLNWAVLTEAERRVEKTDDELLLMEVKIKKGIYFLYKDEFDSARGLYNEVLEMAIKKNDSARMAIAYNEIGTTYYNESNDKQALANYIKSYRIFEKLQDTLRLGSITNNMGNVYRYLKEPEKAVDFFRKAIRYKLLLNDSSILSSTYHNMAISKRELNQPDSALYYFGLAKKIRERNNDQLGLSKSYVSIANIMLESGQLDSAVYYFTKSIDIGNRLGNYNSVAVDLISRSEAYYKLGRLRLCIEDATKGLKMVSDVRSKKDAFKILADANARLENYQESYQYQKWYAQLSDSIYESDRISSLRELQVQFDTELKDAEIQQLAAQNQIQVLEAEQDRQFRIILIILAISLIAIATLLYVRFRSKTKTNQLLESKNLALNELNYTKDRLFSIISHDLKSPLSSFHTITKSLTDNWDKIEKEQLKSFIENLRDSSKEVHNMMDNLLRWALSQTGQLKYNPVRINGPEVVDDIVLQLATALKANNLEIEKHYNQVLTIDADTDYLKIILRNLISNAIKFSDMGKTITLIIEEKGDAQIISVQDQGIGIKAEDIEKLFASSTSSHEIKNSQHKGTGLGLTLCRELMEKMGGKIEVSSEYQKGTVFSLVFSKAA